MGCGHKVALQIIKTSSKFLKASLHQAYICYSTYLSTSNVKTIKKKVISIIWDSYTSWYNYNNKKKYQIKEALISFSTLF